MNEDRRDQTQFSPEKKTLEKEKWVCYYLYIRYVLSHRQTNKKTNKQKNKKTNKKTNNIFF